MSTEKIRKMLTDWYVQNHRQLPWRESRNPYHIWISEVMLQQTQVDTVIDYYLSFIERFPDIETLAGADEEDVLKAWEGLGYYSRARNLQRAAREIMERHGGRMPEEYAQIRKLSGIGPYTAGAIASIAFGQAYPAVDGNVMRVFSRLYDRHGDITTTSEKKWMEEKGAELVEKTDPALFNQGLMELGAMVCTPKSPKCPACPLQELCQANAAGTQLLLPVKKKKQPQRKTTVEVVLVKKEGQILIVKRPSEGLLANLWALPAVEMQAGMAPGTSIRHELEDTYGMLVSELLPVKEAVHVFTHIRWEMKLYTCFLVEEKRVQYPELKWIKPVQLGDYALPTAFRKLLKDIDNE